MRVCCIPLEKLSSEIFGATKSFRRDFHDFIQDEDITWIERSRAEQDFGYKQIIPYAILQRADGKIACYRRHGTEKRLHGLYTCGVGGHIDEPDEATTFADTVRQGMDRELSEELANFDATKIAVEYLGLIHEAESEVGLLHLGVVYVARCAEGYLPAETDETRGLEWKTADELKGLRTELWSQLVLELLEER